MILRWEDEIRQSSNTHYVLKRQSERVRPFLPLHRHEYGEIFFIQKGNCSCIINGTKHTADKNHIIFTRPELDEHCIESCSEDFEMIQVMFEKDSYSFLHDRYKGRGISRLWTDRAADFRHIHHVNPIWFESCFNRLLTADGSLFELDHFLINLLDYLENSKSLPSTEKNDWLDYALREIRKPENFRNGTGEFARLCGKSLEHIERKLKTKTGYTVSQIVNRARMQWASYMLVFTSYDIQNISYDCGFKSQGHFYKVFKNFFGETPHRYRKSRRNTIDPGRRNTIEYLYNPFILMDEDADEG